MSPIRNVRMVGLTLGEIGTLLALLQERHDSGDYVGNREQYYAHIATLTAKLKNAEGPQLVECKR